MDVVTLALVLAVAALAVHYLNGRRRWRKAVDLLPGPPAAPIIGNTWDILWTYKFNQTQAISDWTQKYGGIFRMWVGPNMVFVVISNPEDLEILLSSTKHIEKADPYKPLHRWIGTGLLTSTGKKWHTRRKMITPSFHLRILDQFMEVFDKNSSILTDNLLKTTEPVNVHSLVALCTLDIICETAMGTKVDAQNDSTSRYVSAVHEAVTSFHRRSMKPWLSSDVAFGLTADGKTFDGALQVMQHYTREVIESRRRERESNRKGSLSATEKDLGLKKRSAFLDQLLEASDTGGAGSALLDEDIQEEVDTFMFEGHDTTAAALSFIMYNVAANQEVQDRLAEEMRDIFGDSDRPTTSQDVQNMKYAERVVKESLRLYPSVPLFGRVLKEDLPVSGGRVIPARCQVVISCLEMGRDPRHWPDPEKFDPDRFLPENSAGRHPYAYVPFSAGPRNCIGQKFAMMEMKSSISKIIRRCKLSLPYEEYKPEVEGQVILKASNGVLLKVASRATGSRVDAGQGSGS